MSAFCSCGKDLLTRPEADARAAYIGRRDKGAKTHMNVYRCPDGHGWHVGHVMSARPEKHIRRLRRRKWRES